MFKPFLLSILTLIGTSAFPSEVPFVDYVATPINVRSGLNAIVQASGISNSGLIVGYYSAFSVASPTSQGLFLYNSKSGSSTLFDFPSGVPYYSSGFRPSGVNNSGTIIGSTEFGYGTMQEPIFQGYMGTSGALLPLTFPGSISTEPLAINDAGVIVGGYLDANHVSHGFTYQPDGTFQTVDAPRGQTVLNGINNFGQIIGVSGNDFSRNFLLANETYTFDIGRCGPPAFDRSTGINDLGFASSLNGVLLNTATNSCTFPLVNGTMGLEAVGINDSGALIAKDDNIYTPAPEPGSLILTISGGIVSLLCIWQTARRRSHSAQTKREVA